MKHFKKTSQNNISKRPPLLKPPSLMFYALLFDKQTDTAGSTAKRVLKTSGTRAGLPVSKLVQM